MQGLVHGRVDLQARQGGHLLCEEGQGSQQVRAYFLQANREALCLDNGLGAAMEEDEEKMELVVIVYDLVLVENLAKHKSIDGITIAEVDSASGHLSHADLLDEGEVFYVLDSGGYDKDLQGDVLLIRRGATQSPPLRNQVLD